jgi:transposase
MVTIAWDPLGFPLIVALPKGGTLNAECYRDSILAALTQLHREDDGRKLVVHADNARVHTAQKWRNLCEENGLRLTSHPSYSPDLALSHFFLFGYVKEHLKGMLFPSYEELLKAIGEAVTGIESETLTAVFEHWNECLKTMVITIHKLPVGSFTFLQCLSGTELLNSSGTPYTNYAKTKPLHVV